MKIVSLSIGISILISSCISNKKEYVEDVTVINEINDKVAFENRCKLTATYTNQTPDEIDLKIGNTYTDPLYPGKILFDFYNMVELTDLEIKEYNINDGKEKLYSFTKDDFSHLTHKRDLSKSLLAGFKSHDLTKFYNQFDTIVKSEFTFQDFNSKLLEFDFKTVKFSGFQLVDSILVIGYGNSQNQIKLVYKWNLNDNKVYGFSVE